MDIPKHLKHKPIIVVKDYDKIDGHYANETDAFFLSLGEAQYDHKEISAKVLRNTKGKWSRQSEELPLHRVLDLAILIASTLKGKSIDHYVETQEMDVEKAKKIHAYYKEHQAELDKRMNELRKLL